MMERNRRKDGSNIWNEKWDETTEKRKDILKMCELSGDVQWEERSEEWRQRGEEKEGWKGEQEGQ